MEFDFFDLTKRFDVKLRNRWKTHFKGKISNLIEKDCLKNRLKRIYKSERFFKRRFQKYHKSQLGG